MGPRIIFPYVWMMLIFVFDYIAYFFEERLTELNKEGPITYTTFSKNVIRAAKETATTFKGPTTGWFEENKELLKPPNQREALPTSQMKIYNRRSKR